MKILFFGGYELKITVVEDDVFVTCKGVTGTLKEGLDFMNRKKGLIYNFGTAKIKQKGKDIVQIGCLSDSNEKFKEIVNYCIELKNGKQNKRNA